MFELLLREKATSIDTMTASMREHLYLYLKHSRTTLKATFHRLEDVLKRNDKVLERLKMAWHKRWGGEVRVGGCEGGT